MNVSFWDDRYKEEGFAYGSKPNAFIAIELKKLKAGSILFPAEGEGRNAVYAAQLGWDVVAFDMSEAGRGKAMLLASEHGVTMNYQVCDATAFVLNTKPTFDAVVFCFTHFPGPERVEEHRALASLVKPGGMAIMEVFAKGHEEFNSKDPRVGGPRDSSMLFSEEEVKQILNGFQLLELTTEQVELNEGKYHVGTGLVVRVLARRNSDFTE
jgi:SAM-dependent methyltransferase